MRIFQIKFNKKAQLKYAVLCFFLLLSFYSSAQIGLVQDPNAQKWLTKMAEAKRSLNYEASFIISKPGSDPQPYLWRHGVSEDGIEMEHLDQQNGPGREVVRIGNNVSYFESHRPAYTLASGYILGPLPHVLLNEPMSLLDAYEFVVVGKGRISGRAAQQIRMVSKDKSRFGYNLWLDHKTGLPLKINMMDIKGQKIEQIQITTLDVTDTPSAFFERIDTNALPEVVQLPDSKENKQNWQLGFVPVGMEQVKHSVRQLPENGGPLEYIMISDGLVDVSVYLQRATATASESDIVARFGSDIYYSRVQGSVLVTVIGKIPASTANALASSITLVQ
ncbi:MucB/RseB C-terminal domain-containing protein [Aliiglaciecola sp. M165]|uniref:MucB/RseB C-terminal domain-containing protein n=1 Tax=Aliiglaciecola sp. M165 TaxID=2593649 RepID=UPI0021B0A0BB|nr:MucB/RseB C-terminal domain-containing protein [Aliiglaciecola sp. M165]